MRYFFSFMARTLVPDEVGKLFPNEEAARGHAVSIAADCVKAGVLEGCSVLVARNGKTLFEVPMLASFESTHPTETKTLSLAYSPHTNTRDVGETETKNRQDNETANRHLLVADMLAVMSVEEIAELVAEIKHRKTLQG